MLEIYNEQVRDLLNFQSMKQKGGLKVRENPKRGFYGKSKSKRGKETKSDNEMKVRKKRGTIRSQT